MANAKLIPEAQAETISLAKACRRVGIAPSTAAKLMPQKFPEAFWLGGKRVIGRRAFDKWLAEKIGATSAE